MVFIKQSDFFALSIRESHTLKEGEKSTEVKSTIVSATRKFLFLKYEILSHEVQKKTTIKKVKKRKNIIKFKM
jgi:hypothetical protein